MSLQAKLDAFTQTWNGMAGAEAMAIRDAAVESVKEGRLIERALKAGDQMPTWALPDAAGTIYRSADFLTQGRLVVDFYRGLW